MAQKYLDYDGLLYFWQKLKAYFVADVTYNSTSKKIQKTKAGTTSDVVTLSTVATSGSYNDLSNKPTIPSSVEKSTTTPKMDGTASVGSETKFAAGDHVHPTDTSRVPTTRKINGKSLNADVTLVGGDINVNSQGTTTVAEAINDIYSELDDKVDDVRIGGTTIVSNGVADIPYATHNTSVQSDGIISHWDKVKLDKINAARPVHNVQKGCFINPNASQTSASWLVLGDPDETPIAISPEYEVLYQIEEDYGEYKAGEFFYWGGTSKGYLALPYLTSVDVADIPIFDGATSSTAGSIGLVPAPSAKEQDKLLYGDADWHYQSISYGRTQDSPNLLVLGISKDGTNTDFPLASTTQSGLMTTQDKTKLNGIASGANKVTYSTSTHTGNDKYSETMVQITKSDGSVSQFYAPTTDVATTAKRGLMSPTDKSKLDGIASGAEVNVNADWNATSGDAKILNKPTLGTAASKDVVTSISSDSTNLPTVTAVKNYVQTAVTGAAAFQGTAPTTFAPTNYKAGYYWVVGTAGTYVGQVCEAGDMIFATADGTSYSASDFDVVQTNLDITAITNAEIDTIMAS